MIDVSEMHAIFVLTVSGIFKTKKLNLILLHLGMGWSKYFLYLILTVNKSNL